MIERPAPPESADDVRDVDRHAWRLLWELYQRPFGVYVPVRGGAWCWRFGGADEPPVDLEAGLN